MSALQQTWSQFEKGGLNISCTAPEAPRFIAQGVASIFENSVLSATATAGSEAFKAEKESLQRVFDKLKVGFSSRHGAESNPELAELV